MSDAPDKITIRIAIDIPVEVAAETVQIIEPALARLTAGLGGKPETTVESEPVEDLRLIARQELERKKDEFFAKAPRAYAIYRRVRPQCETALQAYKIITRDLRLDAAVAAEVLVQKQRRKLKQYIHNRRQRTVVRLGYEGWSNKAIAKRLGVATRTVARIFADARASNVGRQKKGPCSLVGSSADYRSYACRNK